MLAADLNKGAVQVFNSSGTWQEFWRSPTTRMVPCAIKSLVTDASLTSGVDYGFAYGHMELQVFLGGVVEI